MPDISCLFLHSGVSAHWTKLESMFLINSGTERWHNAYGASSKACCQIIVHIFKCEQGSHIEHKVYCSSVCVSWRAINHRNTLRANKPSSLCAADSSQGLSTHSIVIQIQLCLDSHFGLHNMRPETGGITFKATLRLFLLPFPVNLSAC